MQIHVFLFYSLINKIYQKFYDKTIRFQSKNGKSYNLISVILAEEKIAVVKLFFCLYLKKNLLDTTKNETRKDSFKCQKTL